jgi:rod shape-determining protein MreC
MDSLIPNLPVLTADGLVGRVSEVSETRSRVLLVGDAGCRVAAAVLDEKKNAGDPVDTGVITSGASVLDESMVELSYLRRASAVKPGQRVVTSGDGGIFPKGIHIGEVVDTRPAEFGVITIARVKLAVKMNLLEEIWVMMP